MKRFIGTLLFLKLLLGGLALFALGQPPPAPPPAEPPIQPAADPAWAIVRIKSHGASATIIWTSKDRSYLLGCAHMLEDSFGNPSEAMRTKKLVIDGPAQPHAPKKLAEARLVAFDHGLDLSLIEIDNGPFHYIPVAPRGHSPSRNIRSMGFDNMSWPVTDQAATITSTDGDTTYTREKPWHGRSGGGLIDRDQRCLIGVVQGYEVAPGGRGVYVSHDAVLRFLAKHRPGLLKPVSPLSGKGAPLSRKAPSPRPIFLPPGPCLPGGV